MKLNYLILYVIVWWLVFYMTLPHGYKSQKKPQIGNDRSAPIKPFILRKAIITSLLSLILTVILVVIIKIFWE